jgi:hypothetical protein
MQLKIQKKKQLFDSSFQTYTYYYYKKKTPIDH